MFKTSVLVFQPQPTVAIHMLYSGKVAHEDRNQNMKKLLEEKKYSRYSTGSWNVTGKKSEDLMQNSIHMHQDEATCKNTLFKNTEYLWISWGKAADVVIDLLENKASIHKSKTPLGKTSRTKIEFSVLSNCIFVFNKFIFPKTLLIFQ